MHRDRLLANPKSSAQQSCLALHHFQVSTLSAGISVLIPDLSGDVEQIWALDGSRNSPVRMDPSEKCF